ncbi:MAG: beta-L-arabinofuranosidase domain-containing protein, partial [Oryzihumus sp.]
MAGTFSSIIDPSGRSYPAQNLAVFSATTGAADLSFAGGTNNTVTSLATDGGSTLYLGGTFGTVNGQARKGLAALDTTTGALRPWSPSVAGTGQVDAVAWSGGSVYAAGNFTSVSGGGGTSQAYVAKVDASSGAVDTGWAPAPDGRVRALNVAAGGTARLFLGGDFTSVSAKASTNKVAAVALTGTGGVDTGFKAAATNAGSYAPVFDLISDGTRVYTATAGSGGACAALDVTSGALVWSDHSNGNMQSVRLNGGQLYCAGHLIEAGVAYYQSTGKRRLLDVSCRYADYVATVFGSEP